MANAADYLQFSTRQLNANYKLRTRSVPTQQVVVTNTARDYILTVFVDDTFDGATVLPAQLTLQPLQSATLTVTYDVDYLETLAVGTIPAAINFRATAEPVYVHVDVPHYDHQDVPHYDHQDHVDHVDAPSAAVIEVRITPPNNTFNSVNETNQYVARLYVNGVPQTDTTFGWDLTDRNGFAIGDSGFLTAKAEGNYSTQVVATVTSPEQYVGQRGTAIAVANTGKTIVDGTLRIVVKYNDTREYSLYHAQQLSADITIQELGRTVTGNSVFNLPPGQYTIIANAISGNGGKFTPSGGGMVSVSGGAETTVTITYDLVPVVTNVLYGISIHAEHGSPSMTVGETIPLSAQTYAMGNPPVNTELGPITFTATNTIEGTLEGTYSGQPGFYTATFTSNAAGTMTVQASHEKAGFANTQLVLLPKQSSDTYELRLFGPTQIISGEQVTVTAEVWKNGQPTNETITFETAGCVTGTTTTSGTTDGGFIGGSGATGGRGGGGGGTGGSGAGTQWAT